MSGDASCRTGTGASASGSVPPSASPASRQCRGMTTALLALHDVHMHFPVRDAWGRRSAWLHAVDGVSLSVARGEILGVVGESGCGKTTLGKTIVGINRATSGEIVFEGNDIGALSPRDGRVLRRTLQYCYQDPGASLD